MVFTHVYIPGSISQSEFVETVNAEFPLVEWDYKKRFGFFQRMSTVGRRRINQIDIYFDAANESPPTVENRRLADERFGGEWTLIYLHLMGSEEPFIAIWRQLINFIITRFNGMEEETEPRK